MFIDHVVLWVEDPEAALAFYTTVLGLSPERADEFARGKAPFPSVRVNEATIIDLMDTRGADAVARFTGAEIGSTGHPVNHLCLAMSAAEYRALAGRLADHGIELKPGGGQAFGAQGLAEISTYFNDPDGNVIEIRHYA
jgi:catechol 2,3-dioxygenase-like lactoylglutathione lyase family enzyme